jgi:hypothetical protein
MLKKVIEFFDRLANPDHGEHFPIWDLGFGIADLD